MKDIKLAIKILEEGDYALVVVKNEEIIYKSREKGIKPMYILSTEMKELAKGASIADKVIGRGAALLYNYLDINKVHGNLISKAAIDVLDRSGIDYTYDKLCEYIKNKDGSDYCPVEKISMATDNIETFLRDIKIFLNKINTKESCNE